jgi:hypothetical protein
MVYSYNGILSCSYHECDVEWKKQVAQLFVQHGAIYIMFKNIQKQCAYP